MQHGTYGFNQNYKTEYGLRWPDGDIRWAKDREHAIFLGADLPGFTLVAREVSEPRTVSI